ncbi:hypothetical protein ABPG74_008983 [Tetrahymena malaccensis]
MQIEIEEKQNVLAKQDQWLSTDQIKMIVDKLTTSQQYKDIKFFEIKKNKISFILFSHSFQKQNLIVFVKEIKKKIDNTEVPFCYFQEEFMNDIFIKEFDVESYQKTQKVYCFQDIIEAQQDFQFVKIIQESKIIVELVKNLSLCTNLIKFSLDISQTKFVNQEDHEHFLLEIAESLKNCYHLQSMIIRILAKIFDNYQIEQFIETTTQFENLTKYYLTLNMLQLDLNNLQNIGNSFRNFKKLQKLEIHLWSNQLNHEGVSRLYSQISNIKPLKKLIIDLQENNIKCQGAAKLGSYLENFQELEELKIDLWSNQIQQNGIDNLVSSICKIQSLRHLQFLIWSNETSYEGITQALYKLSQNSKIYHLDLGIDQDNIQPSNMSLIVRNLRNFSKIYWFQIDEFSTKLNGEIKLVQAIKKNLRLVHFKQISALKY